MRKILILLTMILLACSLCACEITITITHSKPSEHIHSLPNGQVVRQLSCTADERTVGRCSCGEYVELVTKKAPGSHRFQGNVCTVCLAQLGVDLEFRLQADGASYCVTGMGSCTAENLVIPGSFQGKPVTQIGPAAFFGQKNLLSVEISEGVEVIGHAAFSDTLALSRVQLPRSLKEIHTLAFSECWSLKTIFLPAGVQTLGGDALLSHGVLEAVYVSLGNPHLCDVDGVLYTKDMLRLLCYPSNKKGSTFTVPDTIKEIRSHAFARNENLQAIVLPEGLVKIAERSFYLCKELLEIVIPGSVQSIGAEAFAYCKAMKQVTLEEGVRQIERASFDGCTKLESVQLPLSLQVLPDFVFTHCTALRRVDYSGTVRQWQELEKGEDWSAYTSVSKIQCSDGDELLKQPEA